MRASDNIKSIIKRQEGFMPNAYLDPPKNTRGLYSIGYGHQIQPNETALRSKKLTQAEANLLFDTDLKTYENAVNASLKRPVSQAQFDALVDFAYNCGTGAAAKVITTWNTSGDSTTTVNHLVLYNKANGVVNPNLVKRRAMEASMFQGFAYIGASIMEATADLGKKKAS